MNEPPKRKRRWFQFSLRSLMIAPMDCAAPITFGAPPVHTILGHYRPQLARASHASAPGAKQHYTELTMNASEDGDVDELVAKALPDRVPPVATARLRSQLAGFRSRLATVQPPSRVAACWIRPVYWGLGSRWPRPPSSGLSCGPRLALPR